MILRESNSVPRPIRNKQISYLDREGAVYEESENWCKFKGKTRRQLGIWSMATLVALSATYCQKANAIIIRCNKESALNDLTSGMSKRALVKFPVYSLQTCKT